jgi:hypothetical protein
MGAESFSTTTIIKKSDSNEEAFRKCKDSASYENGHGGYTGTIAEKHGFIMIHKAKSEENANRIVDALMGNGPAGVSIYRQEMLDVTDDKWGPAGAVRYPIDAKTDGVIFFGWASS